MKTFLLLFVLAGSLAPAAERDFPHPDRIRYDGQCFTIDGKDLFIFSGAFHYFRCPKELWRERFQAIRAAGCNTVETYVPWNYSERRPPSSPDDFSQVDLAEFRDWLRMAQDEFHFYTIIRPGPYICAEWDGGGFPRWLLTMRPGSWQGPWLRSDEPAFLAWSTHWLRAVCPLVAEAQVTRRAPGTGGVILFQLENEYDLEKTIPEKQRAPHLRALYAAAKAGGIEVPLFSCWTRQCRESDDPALSHVFDAFNAYPRFKIEDTAKRLAELESAQPDAPAMISELQGGWFGKVGGLLSEQQPGLTPEQLQAHTLLAIAHGATALNYYMIFGGTNFGLWGAREQTTSYDYDAPIREWGGTGYKYRSLAAIGAMLREYGPELARSRPAAWSVQSGNPDIEVAIRVARSGATWFFFHNRSLKTSHRARAAIWTEKAGEVGIDYDLGAFGSKVLRMGTGMEDASQGEWLPRLGAAPVEPAPPTPQNVRFDRVDEKGRVHAFHLQAVPKGALLPDLAVFDARPVVYRADVELTAEAAAAATVLETRGYADDRIVAEVNGHPVAGRPDKLERNRSGDPLPHQIGVEDLPVAGWLHAGVNRVRLLYVQKGQANFGPGIDDEPGLRSATLGAGQPFRVMQAVTGLALEPLQNTDFSTTFRCRFGAADAGSGPRCLWLDAVGDGELILNGHSLGRYWDVGPQHRYYLPECWMRPQSNELVLTLLPSASGNPPMVRSSVVAGPGKPLSAPN